jgi:hypothetical protein
MKCAEVERSARETTEAERVRLDFLRIQSQASIAYFVLMQCARARANVAFALIVGLIGRVFVW